MKIDIPELKRFISLVENKQLQNKIAAAACGYTPEHFCRLRKKFKRHGDRIFIHAHCGKKAYNAIPEKTRNFIVQQYKLEHTDTAPVNFAYFTECIHEEYGIKISYKSVYNILHSAGIVSPETHNVKRKSVHRKRFRRAHSGELLQLDATPFQWFLWCGDTTYYALHGALDDATSGFTGLYLCKNECRYGYIEVRRQTFARFGMELEDYTDKAAIFHHNTKEKERLTVAEQLRGDSAKITQWERMNTELSIQLSCTGTPEAKGKIERGWETVQGRLPALFRKHKIRTIKDANIFLQNYFLFYYNKHFARAARNAAAVWRVPPQKLENILCVRESRRIMKNGCIRFAGLIFRVENTPRTNCGGEICITEHGLWFLLRGKRYELTVLNDFCDTSAAVSEVLNDIIYRYMFDDCKEHCA